MARRRPIVILYRNDAKQWVEVAATRAAINGTGGGEYHAAGAEQADTTKVFNVKHHPSLARLLPQNTRILYAGMRYDVKTIDDFEERHIELNFKAVANYGR